MKKLLVSVLAIAGLVACSQEQTLVQSNNSGTLMEFNVAALDNATRVDPSITSTTLDAFDIWAYVDSKAGTVLTEELVSRNGDMWSYVNKQYWTPNHTYYFDAIAPVDTDIFKNNWTYNQAEDTIDFTNEYGTEDLIYAHVEVTTPDKFDQYMEAVGLEFNHLLSKVKFTFKNGFTTDNVYVAVENVVMKAPAAGTYTTTTGAWALKNGTTTLLAFGNVTDGDTLDIEGTKVFAAQKSVRTADERFTIPAGTDQKYEVTFTVKHYNGNVCLSSSDKKVEISGLSLESGKAYNFVTEINEQNAADAALLPIEFKVDVNGWEEVEVAVAEANSASDIQRIIDEAVNEAHIVLNGHINLDDLLTRASSSASITIPAGKEVVLDIKEFNITGTDNDTANFGMFNIQPGAKLTIDGTTGKIQLTATKNRGWNAYSSVISNQRGEFVLNGGTIEHLGGTDMAYGIDNLTNGKGTKAVTTINGGTVKSTYRAVRQFLNGTEAFNELYVNGGTIEGANKSIWMQDTNKSANPGKLVVAEGAQLKGDVYLFVTAGSPEWPVEVSIASSALVNGSKVTSGNVPAGYDVVEKNGNYVVEYGVEVNGNEIAVSNAGGLKWIAQQVNSGADYFAGKTVKLVADIDLKGAEWTPIGTETNNFEGNFDGAGKVIKNLYVAISEVPNDGYGYVYAGLFGVTSGSETQHNSIKNLVIENVKIETEGNIVAAAVAYPYYTDIENVTVKGDISIKGGDYTAGVLAYTRRCVNVKDVAIIGNAGSVIEGGVTIGGVISDIQTNGGLTANYSNFAASGLTIKGAKNVGGISGIICLQTLDGATVENVTIVCNDARKGIVAGSLGGDSTINRVSVNNVSGADYLVGPLYGTNGHTVTIDGVVYEYLEDGSIMIDGKLSVANGVLADDAAYYISNKAGMFWFANEVNVNKNAFDGKTVKLTADVDLNNEVWTPVGQTGAKTFNGVFDGQNYTIYNLNVDSSSQTGKHYSSGLFGWVETHSEGKGILKNVKIENATIKGNHNCGALVGYITEKHARVQNCHVVNASIECHYANGDADGDKAGALIGNATNATLVDGCSATNSTVSAGRDAGQLIGAAKLENVTNCSATNVTVTANGEGTGNNIRNEVVGRVL